MSADAADIQNITGVWQGFYSYADSANSAFTATLLDSGAHVTGTIHEPDHFGDSDDGMLFAQVAGARNGSGVAFTKTYDGTGGWDHDVTYEGTLNADATEIEGRWTIAGDSAGRFLMIRSGAGETVIAAQESVGLANG